MWIKTSLKQNTNILFNGPCVCFREGTAGHFIFFFQVPTPFFFPYWTPVTFGQITNWSPLHSFFVVHVWYLFLKDSADVDASTFKCGGEKTVGDAEALCVQVKVLYLKEDKGKTQMSVFWEIIVQKCWPQPMSGKPPYLFKRLQTCFLPQSSHVL